MSVACFVIKLFNSKVNIVTMPNTVHLLYITTVLRGHLLIFMDSFKAPVIFLFMADAR